jgi:hypothetical protein
VLDGALQIRQLTLLSACKYYSFDMYVCMSVLAWSVVLLTGLDRLGV